MNKYLIRFNKSRGQPGRGTYDQVWRVFENGNEFLAKHLNIQVPTYSETDGQDWNIACNGFMTIENDEAVITASQPLISYNRTCDGCTACCQGYLSGQAYGHIFQQGQPCFFVAQKGCSIYENRPDTPCKSFMCDWLKYDYLPMWMRPDLSKVIVRRTVEDNVEWVMVVEAGQKMDASILSWILIWATNNKVNIKYQVDGGWNWIKNA